VTVDEPVAAHADYVDAFEIRVPEPDDRTAEAWVRCALERLPTPVRWLVFTVHRSVLRFRLAPLGAPDHVLGWAIAVREPDVIVLQTSSSFLGATLIGRRSQPTHTSITTALHYRRPVRARVIWTLVGPLHRRIAPLLLERAAAGRPEAAGTTAAHDGAG
jgi:hypothetical protein